MKKRIITILLCIICAIPLSGCTLIFDFLNFYSPKLPTIKSEIDPALKNPYPRIKNAITKEVFSEILQNTISAMDGSFDEHISIIQNNEEKRIILQYVDEPEDDKPYGYVKYNNDSYYLYEDGFAIGSYWSYYKYIFHDDFLETVGFYPYDIITNGSVLTNLLALIKKGLISIDSDFENGKQIYIANSNIELNDIKKALPLELNINLIENIQIKLNIIKTDELNGQKLASEKVVISGIDINLQAKNSVLRVSVLENSFAKKSIDNTPIIENTFSAYIYYVNNLIQNFNNMGWFGKNGYALGKYEFYNEKGATKPSYTLYCTQEIFTHKDNFKDHSTTITADGSVLTAVLNDGTKICLIDSPFKSDSKIYKIYNNGKIETFDLDNNREEYFNYYNQYFSYFYIDIFNIEYINNTENEIFFTYEERYDNIKRVTNLSYKFDKVLNILTGYTNDICNYYYDYEDFEMQNPISVEQISFLKVLISYGATIQLPSELLYSESSNF